ncbi:phospholipase D-like domain-containing protein [Streptosporangium sp. NPDC023963]|uniref:phospholipase D-like domain-containing protein n=1 Tax=Streptosporangium sp. NPDC023963 TaxID=3155608 RepID=UPI00342BEB5A
MHAKVIAADRATAFLGSVNLTDSAYTDNLEIGAVIYNPSAVANIVNPFETLMRSQDGPLIRMS